MRRITRGLYTLLYVWLGACSELSDEFVAPSSDAGCVREVEPFSACEPFLDGIDMAAIALGNDSPCFGVFGEAVVKNGAYHVSKSRQPIIAVDDSDGPHYGELGAYGKWLIPMPSSVVAPYEIEVFLEPDDAATLGAKYKIWTERRGACYRTISQRVASPRWVTLGAYHLGPFKGAMRVDNLTTEATDSARVQFGPVRFRLLTQCASGERLTIPSAERCVGDVCVQLAEASEDRYELRVRRAGPTSVRLLDAASDADLTARTLIDASCFEASRAGVGLALNVEPLLPATRARVEVGDCQGGDRVVFEVLVAICDRPCAGF